MASATYAAPLWTGITALTAIAAVMLGIRVDQIRSSLGVSVLHVITDAGPHPYFRTLIESGGLGPGPLSVGCVGPPGPLQEDMRSLGVSTFALGARSRAGYPAAVLRLARELRRRRTQVVQTHLVDGSLVGLTAARLARTPVPVMTAHHSHELPFHGWRLVWGERLCAGPLCDHVIAPSQQVRQTLTRIAGVPERKIEVVHHGFDLARLDPRRVDGARVRRELGLEVSLVFGAIGRLYPLKNHPALVRAFASALADVPEARLLIVGPGDARPLATLARQLGIADRVRLCGPRDDVPEVLAAIDVFVHPALAESFGMVIVEAMAMARPVLSTPVGIAPEVIFSGETGLLCSSPDWNSLARGLREILALRVSWARIGAAARRRVQAFTAASTAARYLELYGQWLSGN
jgi:glycosyltransferase involved in cell wall biosynthesis